VAAKTVHTAMPSRSSASQTSKTVIAVASWLTATIVVPLMAILVLFFSDVYLKNTVNQGQLFGIAISLAAGSTVIELFLDNRGGRGEVWRKTGTVLFLVASIGFFIAGQKAEKGRLVTDMDDWKIGVSIAMLLVTTIVSSFSVATQSKQ
jgi:hypothetical protein